jgi:hypothetical protein
MVGSFLIQTDITMITKLKYTIFFLACSFLWMSCEEEETDDVSFVTSYPVFELTGGDVVSVISGGAFEDPGVIATENGTEIPVTTIGSVDTSTPGVYQLTYVATNQDGFEGTATREVVVTEEDVSGTDLSGTYLRNNDVANPLITVIKLADGYYETANASGDGNQIAARFLHVGGDELLIPVQSSRFGRFEGSGVITAAGFDLQLVLIDPPNTGITLNRSFTKQ